MPMTFAQMSFSFLPSTMLVVAIAPGFTNEFISCPLYCSTATIELNTCPVASTPMESSTAASPRVWRTSASVNTFEIDWMEKSFSTSPIVWTWPSTVTSAMPKR
jgi:hypothetical protein